MRWIDEPTTDGTEPEKPTPGLMLAAAPAEGAPAASGSPAVTAEANDADEGGGSGTAWGLPASCLVSPPLVLGLLAYRKATRTQA